MARPPYVPPLVTSSRFPLRLAIEQDRVPAGADAEWEVHEFQEERSLATVDIDGLRFRFCGEESFAEPLCAAWRDFVVDGPADFTLSLRGVERQPFETPVAFAASAERAGLHLVKLRGLSVVLDPAKRRAAALVERRLPMQELSNLLRIALWTFAPATGRYLVHAGAVTLPAGVVLLVGPAQSGKSTAARLAAPRPVLSDDAVLLRLDGDRLLASTAGLWGHEGSEGVVGERERKTAPVAAIVTLVKAAHNRLRPLSQLRAALELQCAVSMVVKDLAARRATLAFAEAAAARAPRFELLFSKADGSFWELIDDAIAG